MNITLNLNSMKLTRVSRECLVIRNNIRMFIGSQSKREQTIFQTVNKMIKHTFNVPLKS